VAGQSKTPSSSKKKAYRKRKLNTKAKLAKKKTNRLKAWRRNSMKMAYQPAGWRPLKAESVNILKALAKSIWQLI